MSQPILTVPAMTTTAVQRRTLRRAFRFVLNHFLLLPFGAVIALVWANSEGESYFRFASAWTWPVNEIAMAFFLALIAQEVFEAVMPGGALGHWRHWVTPAAGAVGGLLGAAAAFSAVVTLRHEMALAVAWPVGCAIDLAAAYYVLRLIYPRRSSVVGMVLVLAVITDVIVMVVVTFTAPNFHFHPVGGLALLAALAGAAALRWMKVQSFWPYWIVCGTLSWLSFYWMGIHPALALVPIVPLLPHDPRPRNVFDDRTDNNPIHHAEHEWNGVAQVALFLFGLVNAGVILKHYDTGTWAVLTAALVGRPLGVLGGIGLAAVAGVRLPRHTTWRDMLVMALATASGFTFALFVTAAILPIGAVLGQITLGALATVAGIVVTFVVARVLGVGRFAERKKAA